MSKRELKNYQSQHIAIRCFTSRPGNLSQKTVAWILVLTTTTFPIYPGSNCFAESSSTKQEQSLASEPFKDRSRNRYKSKPKKHTHDHSHWNGAGKIRKMRSQWETRARFGSTDLSIKSPRKLTRITANINSTVREAIREVNHLFGKVPSNKVTIRLVDRDHFFKIMGLPKWTNAIFYRGEIILPLEDKNEFDKNELRKSIKHEFFHSLVHALSDGRCPGWVDEGLAQWAEGADHPILRNSLRKWINRHQRLIDFSELQSGFTQLSTEKVAPAYAQSLYATQELVKLYGFDSLGRYFEELRSGSPHRKAFKKVFGISEKSFQKQLEETLKTVPILLEPRQLTTTYP